MFRLNISRPDKVQKAGVELTRRDMQRIAAKAIDVIQKRCSFARDINDRPMRALSKKYAEKKAELGQPAWRNMMFSGSMLGAMTLTELQGNRAVIGFTRREELAKAQANQKRRGSRWFGLSPKDEEEVMRYADRILRDKLKQ